MIFTRHAGMKLINKRIHSYAHAHSMHIHADQIPRKRCGKENRPSLSLKKKRKKTESKRFAFVNPEEVEAVVKYKQTWQLWHTRGRWPVFEEMWL